MKIKYKTGNYSQSDLSREYGISRRHIGDVLSGLVWKDGDGPAIKPKQMDFEKAEEIRGKFKNGKTRLLLAKEYDVSYNTIRFIVSNQTWRKV